MTEFEMLLLINVHDPCRKCGAHYWKQNTDLIGLTLTCFQCGNIQYLDKLGVVAQPATMVTGRREGSRSNHANS